MLSSYLLSIELLSKAITLNICLILDLTRLPYSFSISEADKFVVKCVTVLFSKKQYLATDYKLYISGFFNCYILGNDALGAKGN